MKIINPENQVLAEIEYNPYARDGSTLRLTIGLVKVDGAPHTKFLSVMFDGIEICQIRDRGKFMFSNISNEEQNYLDKRGIMLAGHYTPKGPEVTTVNYFRAHL